MIKKIISGGQTGVDQAALDAAIARGVQYGGWLPAGRMAEAGPLPETYSMEVLANGGYAERTGKNVVSSDATLIISHGPLTGGSALTARIADKTGKLWLHIDLDRCTAVQAIGETVQWLRHFSPVVLNVAGPRVSSDARMYDEVFSLIAGLLQKIEEKQ